MKVRFLISKIKASALDAEWMLLFKAGWGKLADGVQFFVDQQSFDLVQAHVAEYGNEIVFDYEHQTLKDVKAPAAGWIKKLEWEDGVGIKALVEWTQAAAKHIEEKEYRYFSPVFFIRKSDKRVCGLHSSALTNKPLTTNLTPILAKLEAKFAPGSHKHKEDQMTREQLIAALGLDKDATDEQILAAVAKAGVTIPEADTAEVLPEAVVAALELDDTADTSAVVASINVLKQAQKTGVSAADFKALQDKIADRDANDAVKAAVAKGKVTPDQKDWALTYAKNDPDGFAQYVAKAPVVVPVDQLPGKKREQASGEPTESDLAVASMMDVDPEDLKNYGTEVKHG
jgi:phage I-like protein